MHVNSWINRFSTVKKKKFSLFLSFQRIQCFRMEYRLRMICQLIWNEEFFDSDLKSNIYSLSGLKKSSVYSTTTLFSIFVLLLVDWKKIVFIALSYMNLRSTWRKSIFRLKKKMQWSCWNGILLLFKQNEICFRRRIWLTRCNECIEWKTSVFLFIVGLSLSMWRRGINYKVYRKWNVIEAN